MKKKLKHIFLVLGIIASIAWVIYNYMNVDIFFQAQFYDILNILISIFIAYYLTQLKAHKTKQIEIIDSIINKLIIDVSCDNLYRIENEDDIIFIRLKQREIYNKINLLSEYKGDKKHIESIKYIKDTMDKYWDLISNHINDIDYLSKSCIDLENYVANIKSKLQKLEWDLYFN